MYSKNNKFIKDYQEVDKNLEETRLYFLILGCLFPITEIFIELFKIRLESELISNITVGLVFITAYFLSAKNKFFQLHVNLIFNWIFLIITCFVAYKVIFKPFELLTYSEFMILIFFSYGVFRNLNYFLIFNVTLISTFIVLFIIRHFEFNLSIIYLNSILTLAVLSYTRHIAIRNSNKKLIFSNSIVHNGSSLVIATNSSGEVLFCSKNIIKILGYTNQQVMGMNFWYLTEDKDFELIDYSQKYDPNKTYIRKLKCSNGDYKYIQWQDNKYGENLYVGVGQDVTEKINLQNEYQKLIQSANDIIYKTDKLGNFTFVNDFGCKALGYTEEELIGKHFTSLIRADFVRQISLFYVKNAKTSSKYITQEFPVRLKNGNSLWVSQNVTIERDSENNIISFSAIVRDISDVKQAEAIKLIKLKKIEKFNSIIKELTLKPNAATDTLNEILENIVTKAAIALEVNRASVWNYKNKSIICIKAYNKANKDYKEGDSFSELLFPDYFKAFTQGISIIANNICENDYTKDFCKSVDNDIKALIDIPIFSNAALAGVICFEMTENFRIWEEEDVNFARSIADIISISFEAQGRRKAEKQLLFRSEILGAIARTTEKLLISENIQTTLNESLKIIGEATRVDRVCFYSFEPKQQVLNINSKWFSEKYSSHSGNNWGDVLTAREIPILFEQLRNNKSFFSIINQSSDKDVVNVYGSQNILSTLIFPLFIKNELYGAISFDDCKIEKKWSDDQMLILNSLITNITNAIERIDNENAIKTSEGNFRLLNETIDDVFWLYDLIEKRILYISHSSAEILGIDAEEFYKTDNYWKNYIFDEDKPAILKAHEKVEIDGFYELEYRINGRNGEIKWIYEKSFGIKDENGRYVKSSGICTDITEKKKTELALIESETNFRQINETIQDVFWLYDIKNRKYLYISPNSEEIFGIPDWEFYQHIHMKRNFVFKDDEYVFKNAESWLLKQDSYEIEYRIKKDGMLRWINEKSFAIRNEQGELIRNSGICRDITGQKEAEHEIKQLSLVAEKTTNGILIADPEGKVVWANQSFLELFEIDLRNLVGKRPRDLFFDKKSDDVIKQMEKDNGSNFSREYEVVTYTSKKRLWIELNSTVIADDNGKTIQQIEVINDITEKIKDKNELKRYSLELEFQNTLKEKLINAADIEEIARETLGFVKSNIKNCIRISLLTLDEKKQNLYGYLFSGKEIEKISYNVKEFKSFEVVKQGKPYIENDLQNSLERSLSDDTIIKTNTRSYIVLPVIYNKNLTGTLNIGFDCKFTLTELEVKNLENFTSLLSVAIQQLNLKNSLLDKNRDNIGSLMYAKNIQNTILPNLKTSFPVLRDVCLLFRPRDIVSGDFYWAKEDDQNVYIAVADCTGHGVPGAFLTLIGSKILDQIIVEEKITSPSEILTTLDEKLFNSLNSKKDTLVRDGMEIAICMINKKDKKLSFAGSGLGLIYFINEQEFYVRGQLKSIGDYRQESFLFENYQMDITGNEQFFMATDGYQDQLGGEKYKRLSKKRTIEILNSLQGLSPEMQESLLKKELDKHIGTYAQTDDITVLGFKININ
ncbi:MAG: PAS domain S-box protein [Bacteroidia bacterium]|nr:PAS domain S-box protein [Bacteroidia bacterium]